MNKFLPLLPLLLAAGCHFPTIDNTTHDVRTTWDGTRVVFDRNSRPPGHGPEMTEARQIDGNRTPTQFVADRTFIIVLPEARGRDVILRQVSSDGSEISDKTFLAYAQDRIVLDPKCVRAELYLRRQVPRENAGFLERYAQDRLWEAVIMLDPIPLYTATPPPRPQSPAHVQP